MFAVRIVTADYYLARPIKDLDVCYSEFRESDVKKVPVVRIFGATPAADQRSGSCDSSTRDVVNHDHHDKGVFVFRFRVLSESSFTELRGAVCAAFGLQTSED
ncbi:hypothetical protein F2P81_023981 [Scophthalmus maximus]|uniref:DNA polymerase zeta catalytic subunit N-terminal domain-containing protein n=1 Tax=Scophthalmus maximus TaxID=52904 RepID=A0A6A4RW71_SCOMX|nr:hypothetical protein F2P81_023981 [Scophthalmus maximus]